ncbi:hypothetical protein ACOMHN_045557 [Nucella lapillus]
MELGILHNSPPSTKRGCCAGRLHRLWHGLPPAPWPCTRSQHHSVPSRNLHPLMVPPFLQPHPDLQSAVGNAPFSSKHPAQLPTTDCLLSIISPIGGQPSDAPALSPPSPLQQGGQSSNAPALSPPSPLTQGGQPIALALSPPSPPPQGGQPSDAPELSPSSSTLLLCPSDSTLNICHLNSQSAVKTGDYKLLLGYPGLYSGWYEPDRTTWSEETVQEVQEAMHILYSPEFIGLDPATPWNSQGWDDKLSLYNVKGPTTLDDPQGWVDKPRLYNLKDDPTEHHDLAKRMPDMVEKLKARLAEYKKRYVPPNFPPNDPAADLEIYGGAWTPGWC